MLFFALAVILICLYLYSVRFLDAPLGAGLRALLTTSRLVVLVFMLYLLTLPQTTEEIEQAISPTLYLLLDDSQSMDAPVDPMQDGSLSRWQAMVDRLAEGGLLERWQSKGFPIQIGVLSETSNPALSDSAWTSGLPESKAPTHDSTNFSSAILAFQNATRNQQNAYLLLFTDGRWNQGGSPLASVNQLGAIQPGMQTAPDRRVFSFGVGPVVSLFDVSVDRLETPVRLREREQASVNVSLSVRGETPPEPLRVLFNVFNEQGEDVHTEETSVQWADGSVSQQIALPLPNLDPGDYLVRVEAVPLTIERVIDNNQREAPLKVRQSKDRLLVMTSTPNADFKFLKWALEDNQAIDLHAYMLHENNLRVLGDRAWASQQSGVDQDREPPAETISELIETEHPWSAVVLHNFIWTDQLQPFAAWLREYIETGGGALVVPGAANAQPAPDSVSETLPAPLAVAYNVVPTQALIEAASVESESLRAAWQNLQGGGLPPIGPLYRPNQQLLTASPILQGAAAGGEQTLMERHRYGLGSIVVSRAAGLWKLGLLTEEDWLTPYWISALNESNPQLRGEIGEILTDRFAYTLFDAVQVQYTAPESVSSVTQNGQFVIIETPTKRESLWLSPEVGAANSFRGRYTVIEAGDYVVSEPAAGVTTTFRVDAGAVESANLTQDVEGLRAIAKAGGGEYANYTAWQQLADKIPNLTRRIFEERSFFLGEKWWAAALLIGFLGFEWFLRWRQGMP